MAVYCQQKDCIYYVSDPDQCVYGVTLTPVREEQKAAPGRWLVCREYEVAGNEPGWQVVSRAAGDVRGRV